MSIPSPHEMTMIRDFVGEMLVDSATVQRNQSSTEPAPGYAPAASWQTVATIPCRFPVPIAGSVLGVVYRPERDLTQRRYGMLVAQNANIKEGDRVTAITDLTGRVLNAQPMRVDAVVIRSSHALIIFEEYS